MQGQGGEGSSDNAPNRLEAAAASSSEHITGRETHDHGGAPSGEGGEKADGRRNEGCCGHEKDGRRDEKEGQRDARARRGNEEEGYGDRARHEEARCEKDGRDS